MHVRNHQNDHTNEGFIFAEGKMRAALADQKPQKKIPDRARQGLKC